MLLYITITQKYAVVKSRRLFQVARWRIELSNSRYVSMYLCTQLLLYFQDKMDLFIEKAIKATADERSAFKVYHTIKTIYAILCYDVTRRITA